MMLGVICMATIVVSAAYVFLSESQSNGPKTVDDTSLATIALVPTGSYTGYSYPAWNNGANTNNYYGEKFTVTTDLTSYKILITVTTSLDDITSYEGTGNNVIIAIDTGTTDPGNVGTYDSVTLNPGTNAQTLVGTTTGTYSGTTTFWVAIHPNVGGGSYTLSYQVVNEV